MTTSRLILTLSLSLFTGLTVAACDGGGDADGGGATSPEGRACEVSGEAITCDEATGTASYCGYMELYEAQDNYGDLSQGPCISVEEIECEPGDYRHEGPTSDPTGEDLCPGIDYHCQVVGGEPIWVEQLCNTPLVLRFDQRPIEMIAQESTPAATFDINMRPNSCITTDWPTAATPWLVVDLDGNGSIDGGNELFGSGSRLTNGRHAEHGFAALAEFDSNADGSVDSSDARFGELMLWRDWNADRLSTSGELEPLANAGVERLAVDYWVQTECDERGNCGVQRSAFEFAGGSVGEVVDIYLSCQ
ncbi:Hemolysin-type calcium binding protein [Enhygromyxa salina]|uniref:Hemolysin-type calcium binding protein n=1 Tax=Enhygromyxa salina TaxID=215803 RepID=A0A0C2DHS8_9BACT|nr:hypothetical protein [Enhygromyxa salina]KIG19212.1 Hemolysin-type calcium binding protein [Enhygromyxa salina]